MKYMRFFVIAMAMFAATAASADYIYDFTVNTSSVATEYGYIDLQFNPGASSAGAASAVITNWSSDGTLDPSTITTTDITTSDDDVTGTLPGTVTINNTYSYNDYDQALTFGNYISFDLDLSNVAGNSFALSFFDSNWNPLLTTDSVNGYATTIDVYSTGPVVTNNSNVNNSNYLVTVSPVVPEPATLLLVGSSLGLAGLIGFKRKYFGELIN